MTSDLIRDVLFFIKKIFNKENIKYKKARLLNHTTLEILYYKNNILHATIVTGNYVSMFKNYLKEDLPRRVLDSEQAMQLIRKYRFNEVIKYQ